LGEDFTFVTLLCSLSGCVSLAGLGHFYFGRLISTLQFTVRVLVDKSWILTPQKTVRSVQ